MFRGFQVVEISDPERVKLRMRGISLFGKCLEKTHDCLPIRNRLGLIHAICWKSSFSQKKKDAGTDGIPLCNFDSGRTDYFITS
jgi:hypothetical protein